MAVAYKKDEIISASKVARTFGKVLTNLKAKQNRRVAVVKNNHLEAVILPIEDYEMMADALALLEHIEIYRLVHERRRMKTRKAISLDRILKEQRLAV